MARGSRFTFFTNYIEAVKERGYTGKCYVPHDISVKNFESGRTRIQTLVSAKLNPVHVPMHSVPDRINAKAMRYSSFPGLQPFENSHEYQEQTEQSGSADNQAETIFGRLTRNTEVTRIGMSRFFPRPKPGF